MTWHTVTVPTADLALLQVNISKDGGTITDSHPCPDGVMVTYVIPSEEEGGA